MQCYGLFAFVHPSNSMLHNTQIIADLLNTNPPRKQTSDTNAARPNNKLPILHGIFQLFLGPVWMFIVGLFTLY